MLQHFEVLGAVQVVSTLNKLAKFWKLYFELLIFSGKLIIIVFLKTLKTGSLIAKPS